MNDILRGPRRAALAVISFLVAASTLVAFGESYRALYLWASHHDVPGGWALIWPAMVDTFVCVGELSLFVALTDRWAPRSRLFAWSVTLTGLSVSIAANIGHVASRALTVRATAAVPPLAAAAALAVGLGVLKRVVEKHHADTAPGAGGAALIALRTDVRTGAEDDAEADAEDPGNDEQMHLAGREAIIADLAEQIRDAITTGERWQPDYAALMAATGYQRSWCEKAVREARTVAFLTSVRPPVLAEMNGHAPESELPDTP